MDVLNCIKTRRSIRRFLDRPVEWDKVNIILEAGKEAPTAGNLQNFKFIAVMDPGKRKALATAALEQYWMESAPVHIVVCALPNKAASFYGIRGERLYSIQNCAAAAENMLLAAHAIGLGACWVGAFEEELVKDTLNIDVNGRPQIMLAIGYPEEQPPRPAKLKLVDVVFIERWWGRVKDMGATLLRASAGNERRVEGVKKFVGDMGDKLKKHSEKLIKKSKKQ